MDSELCGPRLGIEQAEKRPEEGVHGGLVCEDARTAEERRPGTASAIGMDTVDDGHCGPEGEVLGFGGEDAAKDAESPQPREENSEGGTVGKVKAQGGGRPAAGQAGQQPPVGVRRPDEPPERGLGRRPNGRGRRPGGGSPQHERALILTPWPA